MRATTYAGRYGLAQDERGSPFWLREPLLQGGGGFVEGDGPVQQSADDLCDRHVDLMSAGQAEDGLGRLHTLRRLPGGGGSLFYGQAAAEVRAESAVSRKW